MHEPWNIWQPSMCLYVVSCMGGMITIVSSSHKRGIESTPKQEQQTRWLDLQFKLHSYATGWSMVNNAHPSSYTCCMCTVIRGMM